MIHLNRKTQNPIPPHLSPPNKKPPPLPSAIQTIQYLRSNSESSPVNPLKKRKISLRPALTNSGTDPIEPELAQIMRNKPPANYGIKYYNNGSYYKGELKRGLRDGEGSLYSSNHQCSFAGTFVNDEPMREDLCNRQDRRTIYSLNEPELEKIMRNQPPANYGIEYHDNSSYYKGEFMEGVRDGEGGLYFSNHKCVFIGTFVNHKPTRGVYYERNGNTYEGGIKDDLFQGKGVYTFSSGFKYVGNFDKGKRNGDGILYYPDGSILHEGLFRNDDPVN